MKDNCHETDSLAYLVHNISEVEAKDTLKEIALGIHYLHCQRRFVHQRLSLECLYLSQGKAIVGGITSYNDEVEETRDNAPPETAEGEYGYNSDIWSLGTVFL